MRWGSFIAALVSAAFLALDATVPRPHRGRVALWAVLLVSNMLAFLEPEALEL